jgi:hypothetical protein
MAQSTREVRQDIERIRAELDGTIDELRDHVRPAAIKERGKRHLRESVTAARQRVMHPRARAGNGTPSHRHTRQVAVIAATMMVAGGLLFAALRHRNGDHAH